MTDVTADRYLTLVTVTKNSYVTVTDRYKIWIGEDLHVLMKSKPT